MSGRSPLHVKYVWGLCGAGVKGVVFCTVYLLRGREMYCRCLGVCTLRVVRLVGSVL